MGFSFNICLTVVLLLSGTAHSIDAILNLDEPVEKLHKRLDNVIPDKMDQQQIAGLSTAVIRDNKIALSKNYGFAGMNQRKNISTKTIYRAES